jgi:hypothetical protein
MQVLRQASLPSVLRKIDKLQTLVQSTLAQATHSPDDILTTTLLPPVQHSASEHTSSNPSLEVVPGGVAHRPVSVLNRRQVVLVAALK